MMADVAFLFFSFKDNDGCAEIVKLDNLQNHCSTCIYDPDGEVTCDKGCNQIITRREYKSNNCHLHFENTVRRQQREIVRLVDQLHIQCCEKKNAESVLTGLRNEIAELHRKATKLTDENIRQRKEIEKLKDVVPAQVAQSSKLQFSSQVPPIWQILNNLKDQDRPNISILECNNKTFSSFAKSAYPLSETNPWFQINVCGRFTSIVMGLTNDNQALKVFRNSYSTYNSEFYANSSNYIFAYESDGIVIRNFNCQSISEIWKEGDVITCGIRFARQTCKEVYFCRNDKEIHSFIVNMPLAVLFPTIYMQE